MKTPKRKATPQDKTPAPTGAARALARLESEEAKLFDDYSTAKKSRDPLKVKLARDSWLKCSESLRKFDLLVEAARRETGELMPVDDVKRWLLNLGAVLHMSLLRAVQTDKHDSGKAWAALTGAFAAFIYNHNPKKDAPCFDVPEWMFRALFADLAGGAAPELWVSFRRMSAVASALALHPGDDEKSGAYLRAEFEKIETENQQTKKDRNV